MARINQLIDTIWPSNLNLFEVNIKSTHTYEHANSFKIKIEYFNWKIKDILKDHITRNVWTSVNHQKLRLVYWMFKIDWGLARSFCLYIVFLMAIRVFIKLYNFRSFDTFRGHTCVMEKQMMSALTYMFMFNLSFSDKYKNYLNW